MVEDNHNRILIERLIVSLDNIKEDVSEIKSRLPEGLTRTLDNHDKDIKVLSKWRTGIVAVGTFLAGTLTFGEKAITLITKGLN